MPALSALLPGAPVNVILRTQVRLDGRPAAGPEGLNQLPNGVVFFLRPHAPAEGTTQKIFEDHGRCSHFLVALDRRRGEGYAL